MKPLKEQILNKTVQHAVFGTGTVVFCSNIYIRVAFDSAEKSFLFPDSFLHFLKAQDSMLQSVLEEAALSDKEPEKCAAHQEEE